MNDGQLPAPPAKRHRARTILAVAAAVVVVALASIATIALLRNATLSSQVAAANARAANAANVAQAAAQKDYAARNAALNREAATLNRKSQAIAAQIGELKANTIRADGMYVAGHDIKSGTWHTAGNGHLSGGLCRYTVLRNASMANNPPGPPTLTAPGRSTCPAPTASTSTAPARGYAYPHNETDDRDA
jgi:cell division protein FtsB